MSDRLRLLFAPHAYAPAIGGTEHLCRRVAERLAADGHDVAVLTSDASAVDAYYRFGVPVIRRAPSRINGVDITRVRLAGGAYPIAGRALDLIPSPLRARVEHRALRALRWSLARQFQSALASAGPDVVIAMPHVVVNVEAVLHARRARPFPLVLQAMLHEEAAAWDVEHVRWALRQADAVMANTRHERDRLVSAYGVPRESVFMAGVGVDPVDSQDAPPGHAPTVVFLGRKAPLKGVPQLIDAMVTVWRARPDARLILAGARGEASGAIEQKIRDLPSDLRARVASEDDVSEARKQAILAGASCLVLPSRVESFGGVILEAWAHGVPVVTFDLPVFRDVVDPGADGTLVRPDDLPALAAAIQSMLDHPERARAMGHAGREKTRARYTWPAIAACYLDACRYAIERFQPHAASRRAPR